MLQIDTHCATTHCLQYNRTRTDLKHTSNLKTNFIHKEIRLKLIQLQWDEMEHAMCNIYTDDVIMLSYTACKTKLTNARNQ